MGGGVSASGPRGLSADTPSPGRPLCAAPIPRQTPPRPVHAG